jgi:hypothetical protein
MMTGASRLQDLMPASPHSRKTWHGDATSARNRTGQAGLYPVCHDTRPDLLLALETKTGLAW